MATNAAPLVSVPTDLTSMVSADAMSAFNDAGSAPDTSVDDGTADLEAAPEGGESFETPEPIGDQPLAEVGEEIPQEAAEEKLPETKAAEPAKEQPAAEELPEGVTAGKNRKGEEGVFVSKEQWNNTIHASHKTIQAVSELLGEPATIEAIQTRNEAFMAQERMYADLTSGNPETQGNVLGFMLDQMQEARQRGEVGVDPSIGMAQAFYSTLKSKSQDGFASLRMSAAKDLVAETFRYAAETGDKALFSSAQHLARMLSGHGEVKDIAQFRATAQRAGIPFYAPEEMDGLARGTNDPVARANARIAELEQQINGRQSSTQAEQLNSWQTSTRQAIQSGVNEDAITPALSSVAEAWKTFPADYDRLVVQPLKQQVSDVLAKDSAFKARMKMLNDSAARASSPQFREGLAAQIRQAYVNRAKLAVEAVKRPILEFAAQTLKTKSATTHDRRAAGQNRTAPQTTGTVNRPAVPDDIGKFPNGVFDPNLAVKQMQRLFDR